MFFSPSFIDFFLIYGLATMTYLGISLLFTGINNIIFSKKHLVILRGLPGSGKTSYIKHLIQDQGINNYTICSAFYYFKKGLVYRYNPRRLPHAYQSCWRSFLEATMNDCPYIFVNNPNAEKWEYENYLFVGRQLGYDIDIVEIDCPGSTYVDYFQKRSRHNVPLQTARAMAERWEDDSSSQIVSCYDSDDEVDYVKVPDTISNPYFNANDAPDPTILDRQLDDYHNKAKDDSANESANESASESGGGTHSNSEDESSPESGSDSEHSRNEE